MFAGSIKRKCYCFTVVSLIAETALKFLNNSRRKLFGYLVLKRKALGNLFWNLTFTLNLQQLRNLRRTFCNLPRVRHEIAPKKGGFKWESLKWWCFFTVGTFCFITDVFLNFFFKATIYVFYLRLFIMKKFPVRANLNVNAKL